MTTEPKTHHRRLAATGLAAVTTSILIGLLLRDVVPPADAWIIDHWYAAPDSLITTIATATSGVGTLLALAAVPAAAITLLIRRRAQGKPHLSLLARGLLLIPICGSVLAIQQLVMRPGPPMQPEASTYPSGHATIATAALFTAAVLFWLADPRWGRLAASTGAVAVLAVSASRVVLAEHWLLDVAGAITATAGIGLLAIAVLRIVPWWQPATAPVS
ncbi:phosphatase PAP2 family protein [Stackebrandtia nassauensis]|uniref:Phosphoesterase PA-phosphatase related protein n=1 Tax=Stackebrandtia nassauensis (strain DSM 44728 / CIP 108903 / NRRL B-16338 / NBRC 102104 / LLR-40K-21) TaxID=446470 RepID=D3PV48_STANL|nr:phosphatase PAP2 family protein [Stackebrandtia nassauensis]ADD41101.1 phosphoesterase PA-phosphatase related protein [Stackebrandtia nassauensis DSM 44728]